MSALAPRMRRLTQRHTPHAAPTVADPWTSLATPPATPLDTPTQQQVVHKITQALTILRSTVEYILDGPVARPSTALIQCWLPPTARQIEASMQHLRALPLAKTQLGIDLAQALTVVVLAADILVQHQHSVAIDLEICTLLCRNADRARHSSTTVPSRTSPPHSTALAVPRQTPAVKPTVSGDSCAEGRGPTWPRPTRSRHHTIRAHRPPLSPAR